MFTAPCGDHTQLSSRGWPAFHSTRLKLTRQSVPGLGGSTGSREVNAVQGMAISTLHPLSVSSLLFGVPFNETAVFRPGMFQELSDRGGWTFVT